MRATVHWLPLLDGWRLAIMPRPRAGEWLADEIAAWKAEGIDIVVSLLEPHEMAELGLQRLPESCRDAGIVRAGRHADAAFEVIGKARGIEVPDTAEQRAWVRAFPATAG